MPLFPDTALPAAPRQKRRETPTTDSAPLKDKALEIHRRLCGVYECPIPYFHSLDPLSELISSLLSHRTRNADSGRAFKALRARWPDWADIEQASVEDIEATIRGVTWPELKAPRIKAVLAAVRERVGALSLDFLGDMSVDEARGWLEAIPGIGPKTSAAVLSFSTLRMPALPVDSHHHRVAQRTADRLEGRCRAEPRGAACATPRRLVGAEALRQPRGADAARPARLLPPLPGLRTLRPARHLPDWTGAHAGRRAPLSPVEDPCRGEAKCDPLREMRAHRFHQIARKHVLHRTELGELAGPLGLAHRQVGTRIPASRTVFEPGVKRWVMSSTVRSGRATSASASAASRRRAS